MKYLLKNKWKFENIMSFVKAYTHVFPQLFIFQLIKGQGDVCARGLRTLAVCIGVCGYSPNC